MRGPRQARESLDADVVAIRDDHLVELALDDIGDLLVAPDSDPFIIRRSPARSGLDDLALTLSALERLPDDLTVRVRLPPGNPSPVTTEQVRSAFRQAAADAATVSWRQAMAVRSMGRRQIPIGGPIAALSAVIAYGAGYLASVSESATTTGVLVVVAMIAITVAWVVSWMVLESAVLDWRQGARAAWAYDLLARSTFEVVTGQPARATT